MTVMKIPMCKHGCTDECLACYDEKIAELRQQLAECQAREKVLRDALESAFGNEYWRPDNAPRVIIQSMQKALALPSDSTALDTMLKAAKREALLEAADWFDPLDSGDCWPEDELRRMAKELE